jgi:hypothetical protein
MMQKVCSEAYSKIFYPLQHFTLCPVLNMIQQHVALANTSAECRVTKVFNRDIFEFHRQDHHRINDSAIEHSI